MHRARCNLLLLLIFVFMLSGCGGKPGVTVSEYSTYSGTDPTGRSFSFEYPKDWTVEEMSLADTDPSDTRFTSAEAVLFFGSGNPQSGVPLLILWMVPSSPALPSLGSYEAFTESDRDVETAPNSGAEGRLVKDPWTTTEVAGLTANEMKISYNTRIPLEIYTPTNEAGVEIYTRYAGNIISLINKWAVFRKENVFYDLRLVVTGDKYVTYHDSVYIHAKDTFKF